MSIEELRKEKNIMECAIMDAILKFELKTKFVVDSVSLEKIELSSACGQDSLLSSVHTVLSI
jgi:hypothetical protein